MCVCLSMNMSATNTEVEGVFLWDEGAVCVCVCVCLCMHLISSHLIRPFSIPLLTSLCLFWYSGTMHLFLEAVGSLSS